MFKIRIAVPTFIYTLLTICLIAPIKSTLANDTPPLEIKVYNADQHSFHVNAVLVAARKQAVLIDSGFTRADALRISASILDSGKELTHILVSNADPDYYFGLHQMKQFFPAAKIVASAAVRAHIAAKMQAKLAYWGPRMAANAPQDLILPELLQETTLDLEGHKLELRGNTGVLAYRPYVWIPDLQAIVGNVAVFSGLHVWTADAATPVLQQAWLHQLEEMRQLQPSLVVPGHMRAGSNTDLTSLKFTENYLRDFQRATLESQNSAELIKKMREIYPTLGMSLALEIGAKVAKGELQW